MRSLHHLVLCPGKGTGREGNKVDTLTRRHLTTMSPKKQKGTKPVPFLKMCQYRCQEKRLVHLCQLPCIYLPGVVLYSHITMVCRGRNRGCSFIWTTNYWRRSIKWDETRQSACILPGWECLPYDLTKVRHCWCLDSSVSRCTSQKKVQHVVLRTVQLSHYGWYRRLHRLWFLPHLVSFSMYWTK